MTALLEFKQKIKGLYAKYEMYLQPLMKFVLALLYFISVSYTHLTLPTIA